MALLREMNDNAQGQIDKLESQLSTTGLPVSELVASLGANARMTGRGGPLIPMTRARNPAAIDPLAEEFDRQLSRVSVAFNRLDSLTTTLSRIPLVTPVQNGQYRLTSGFSYRVDPFTGRGAFHSGLDLAGAYGTTILASAPGRVVVAEHRGPYGNMVEIDHGYGIRTRYAHLQAMYVSVGDRVAFRQKIAAMGSTGRSTGPHLHYEIWFRDVARDPMKFFNAGRYVFEG
jgi:murein DD-endopeptidase MepM/ murein hydrolase activator NlpD